MKTRTPIVCLRQMSALTAACAGLLASTAFADGWSYFGTAEVLNRYVSEGIDEDPGADAFVFAEFSAERAGFEFGLWQAQATGGSSLNEANLFAQYAFPLEGFVPFAGVQYLTFPSSKASDTWEAFVGFEWEAGSGVVAYGEFVYDFVDANGGFFALGLLAEIPQPVERLAIEPYAEAGVDFGFVSGPRRLRQNHLEIGVVATYALGGDWEVFGSLSHSFALSNLDDEGEGDVTWGGVGVGFSR